MYGSYVGVDIKSVKQKQIGFFIRFSTIVEIAENLFSSLFPGNDI